ncbi:hypothetical protein [Streptomyces sp. NPDC060194]|uniref:hypothetical protein n=1 Tax=Streptomyces sp. NPDC060194 TaxID=3347069 RepID=UPI00365769F3
MNTPGRESVVTERVELVCTPNRADVLAGLRARAGVTGATAVRLAFLTISLVGGVLGVALRGGAPFPAEALIIVGVMTALYPHLQAAAVLKTLAPQGEIRTTVGDAEGVSSAGALFRQSFAWQAFRGYRERDGRFVLISRDRSGMHIEIVPLRALVDPADADRLRAILDRNLRRV